MDEEENSTIEASGEKMVPQSVFDRVIKEKQLAAAEKARREMQQEYEAKKQPEINTDELINAAVERMEEKQKRLNEESLSNKNKEEADKLAASYISKLNDAFSRADDFEEVFDGFNHSVFFNTVSLVAKMDNGGDIMYQLVKNPEKLAAIEKMAIGHPAGAKKMLDQLSASMQEIEKAKQTSKTANSPLSRIQSSTVGSDNGEMSIRDLRKQKYLRG